MATRISVSVKGPLGLDDPDQIRGELEAATGLAWDVREVPRERVLTGGIAELVLAAVIEKTAEAAVSAALDAVKRVVERIRSERLDSSEPTVTVEPTDAAPATPATPTEPTDRVPTSADSDD